MMKGIRKGIYLTAAAVLLLAAACTFVFSATIIVGVEGIENPDNKTIVYIYAFLDEIARDNAESEIKDMVKNDDFASAIDTYLPDNLKHREKVKYIASEGGSTGGNWDDLLSQLSESSSMIKIVWDTTKPVYGEEADEAMVYLLAVSPHNDKNYIGTDDCPITSGGSTSTIIMMSEIQ